MLKNKTARVMIKRVLTVMLLLVTACSSQNKTEFPPRLVADNFITLHPDTVAYPTEAKSYRWNYEQGLVLEGIYRVWQKTGDRKYFDYMKKNIDYYVNEDGSIKTYEMSSFNIDNVSPGRVLLHLFEATGETKYKKAADTLIAQLKQHPRTSEGGFWHKKIYPYQMWLDGLFMAEPFYTDYSVKFEKKDNFSDIANQFMLVKKHLKDEKTGLYYHGWDESKEQKWADPVKGTSPNFWGRSLGWFMMALVDVLDSYPKERAEYNEILTIFQELSVSLLKQRDAESRLWYQVIDMPEREGNYIETSASSMFIYAFARGYNQGYLKNSFLEAARESYAAMTTDFVKKSEEGNYFLTNVCSVAGLGGKPYRDGSFEYYISEPLRDNDFKGYGPFLLASIEIERAAGK